MATEAQHTHTHTIYNMFISRWNSFRFIPVKRFSLFFCFLFFISDKQSIGQTVNGEIDTVDYSARTHELQQIIEKQVIYSKYVITIDIR